MKMIRVSTCAVRDTEKKIEGKHLVFKTSIAGIKTRLLIDNGSEAELIDESFVRKHKLNTFKLDKKVKLTLGNGEVVQLLSKAALIDVKIGDHEEQVLCYLAKLEAYAVILGDGWLQTHNPMINWKERTMKFNSSDCLEKGCLTRGISCTEFAVGGRVKNRTEPKEDIEVLPVNAKHFFRMVRKKDHEGYLWVPRETKKALCATITGAVTSGDYDKFMKGKPEYTREELLKRVPAAYHSVIDVFMKHKADELPEHRKEDHQIILEAGKEAPYVRNYKPMSEQELEAVKKYIDEHLEKGFIRPSSSSAAAPVLLVRKPGGGLRFCVDYRALNSITIKNRYPIPLINETLGKLSQAKKFTKLDVISAFNRMRMKEGHEWLTAFNTRYGQFEYLVMPFGLCNAPGTFQSFINDTVREYLDVFCTAYLDDVLIYSENEEEHSEQVLIVLTRLKEKGLQVDIDKCEFSVTKVKYLGLIVTTEGIKMDPEKIEAILKWETPGSVKDVQAFLGFANFYRRFISRFSQRTRPLTELTKGEQITTKSGKKRTKYNSFVWSEDCQKAFEDLKNAFTTAPVLAHYDPALETWVETDSSDFVSAGVLSQMHDGVLKPVAYFSKKMTPAECNYMIYDKELLAIVKSFEVWRPEVASAAPDKPVKVYTDHKNLEHFMTTKQLNRRQARWAEFLSEFNFKIMYRPGKQGEKPDTLTRRSQDLPKGFEDIREQHQFQTLLQEHQLDDDIRKALAVVFCANTIDDDNDNDQDDRSVATEEDATESEEPNAEHTPVTDVTESSITKTLEELIEEAYEKDETVQDIIAAKKKELRKLPLNLIKRGIKLAMGDLKLENDKLYVKGRLYVPDHESLQLHLLQKHHEPPLQGHPGYKSMYQIMRENYFWFDMKEHCKRYAVNCSVCRRSKAYNDKKQGLLNPLPIPNRKWMDVSFDFVEFLPECRRRNRVYQHILVIVDRLTKRRLYEPLTSLSTDELMDAMSRRLFSSYGFPISTVNDRGSQLTAHLWKRVCERYGVRIKFSSAHHPETDGQTENANKVMKNYLRAYVSYTQDNWVDYLSDAEFAANNHVNVSTGMTPFFADHGFHPRCGIEPPGTYEGKGRAEILHADKIIERQKAMRTWLRDQLAWAQEEQTRHANKGRQPHPEYKVGDMVYVNAKHFAFERPSRSLSFKNAGPWKIIRIIDNKAYELEIPDQLKNVDLTSIFHPWKLHLAPSNPFPGQVLPPGPPIAIVENDEEEAHEEWEVLEIVDCRETRKFGVQYKATFVGNWDEWNANPYWQSWTDFKNSKDKILQYHREHPHKPKPPEDLTETG